MTQTSETAGVTSTRRSGTTSTASTADLILARPGDGLRARRVRKFAKRHLDCILGAGLDPWVYADDIGDPYRDGHLDRGWVEREWLGRDLAEAGWSV